MKTMIDGLEPEPDHRVGAAAAMRVIRTINTTMTVTELPMATISVASGAAALNRVTYVDL